MGAVFLIVLVESSSLVVILGGPILGAVVEEKTGSFVVALGVLDGLVVALLVMAHGGQVVVVSSVSATGTEVCVVFVVGSAVDGSSPRAADWRLFLLLLLPSSSLDSCGSCCCGGDDEDEDVEEEGEDGDGGFCQKGTLACGGCFVVVGAFWRCEDCRRGVVVEPKPRWDCGCISAGSGAKGYRGPIPHTVPVPQLWWLLWLVGLFHGKIHWDDISDTDDTEHGVVVVVVVVRGRLRVL